MRAWFGYVRAVTAVLPPEEQARYRAVYCGLCKTLGERYGKAAQLTLNYDFVSFWLLLLALPEEGGNGPVSLSRCPLEEETGLARRRGPGSRRRCHR